ncbi:MAG: class I SAM-dependent methyltransferase [Chloroflexi bacterium]|nr:class I SAM-dependent methyltransferase [Chloroflexota bacterium]
MTETVGWMASPSALKLDYLKHHAIGSTALDIGCGRGWYASALADAGFRVTGMDQTKRVDDERIHVIEGEIQAPLPFDDASFDTVLMFDILEHLGEEAAILDEVARVCRQRLILSVPHADAGPLPQYGLTYLHYIDDTHCREYLPNALGDLLTGHGFQTVSLQLEGQPTIPLAFSEFVRGGAVVRQWVRYAITALYKIGLIYNDHIAGDIFYVGDRTPSV